MLSIFSAFATPPLLAVSLIQICLFVQTNFYLQFSCSNHSFHQIVSLPQISGLENKQTFASSSNGYVSGKPDAEKKTV